MADTAAYLVDQAIPDVPVRQWVLSLPYPLRYRVAFDAASLSRVLGIFVRGVFGWLKRQARDCGIPGGQCGAVTFIQRFGSALNLTPHFHMIAFDGVYAAKDGERPQFYPLRAPEKNDVAGVVVRIAKQVAALMESADDDLRPQGDDLTEIYGASITARVAEGPNRGEKIRMAGVLLESEDADESFRAGQSRSAQVSGFSLHAGVSVRAHDRKSRERLCRYAARPALAIERLEQLSDGRLRYRLKTPWRNGATHVILNPLDFIARLAALVPYPRVNLIRYHGVLAPASGWRPSIVPILPKTVPDVTGTGCNCNTETLKTRRNYAWASLMARVFEIDVLACDRCGSKLRVLAAIHPPDATRRILDCLGLPSRGPPLRPASREATPETY